MNGWPVADGGGGIYLTGGQKKSSLYNLVWTCNLVYAMHTNGLFMFYMHMGLIILYLFGGFDSY